MLNNRFQELSQLLANGHSHWMPPVPQLLKFLPQLRESVHPSLQQFLPPPLDLDDDENDPYGYGEEFGRPTGQA